MIPNFLFLLIGNNFLLMSTMTRFTRRYGRLVRIVLEVIVDSSFIHVQGIDEKLLTNPHGFIHVIEVIVQNIRLTRMFCIRSLTITFCSFYIRYVEVSFLRVVQKPKRVEYCLPTISIDFCHTLKWALRWIRTAFTFYISRRLYFTISVLVRLARLSVNF